MKAISDALQKFLVDFLDRWKEAIDAKKAADAQLKTLKSHAKSKPADIESAKKESAVWALELNNPPLSFMGILVKALGGFETAKLHRAKGLMTIPLQLFLAMKEAGVALGLHERSGLEYETAKDVMHFEVLTKRSSKNKRKLEGARKAFSEGAL
jgi:hypothetical protein